jgi:hypothetical protein
MIELSRRVPKTERVNQRRECRRQLPSTGVVEKEPGERLAPVLEHAHQCPTSSTTSGPAIPTTSDCFPSIRFLDQS